MRLTRNATRQTSFFRLSFLICALLSAAPAAAQEPSIWDRMMNTVGLGGQPSASPSTQQAAAPQAAQPASQPSAPAPSGVMDGVISKIGLGGSGPSIDYTERQKLAVPQQRVLPKPNPAPEPQVVNRASEEGLTKPPGDYLNKIPGPDGQATGLREGDTPKEKKFFLF